MKLNNDEADDLILGDPGYDYPDREDAGAVYLLLGNPASSSPVWNFYYLDWN